MPERPPARPETLASEPRADSLRRERYQAWTSAREAHDAALRATYEWLEDANRAPGALDRLFRVVEQTSQQEAHAMRAYFETLRRG
jgi:hypothetical protein